MAGRHSVRVHGSEAPGTNAMAEGEDQLEFKETNFERATTFHNLPPQMLREKETAGRMLTGHRVGGIFLGVRRFGTWQHTWESSSILCDRTAPELTRDLRHLMRYLLF
jgi:hypothetical protein